jgi:hypothetical protein
LRRFLDNYCDSSVRFGALRSAVMASEPEAQGGWKLGSILGWGGGFAIGLVALVLTYLAWQYPVLPEMSPPPVTANTAASSVAPKINEAQSSALRTAPSVSSRRERVPRLQRPSPPRTEPAAASPTATRADGVTITQINSPGSVAANNIDTVNMGPRQ